MQKMATSERATKKTWPCFPCFIRLFVYSSWYINHYRWTPKPLKMKPLSPWKYGLWQRIDHIWLNDIIIHIGPPNFCPGHFLEWKVEVTLWWPGKCPHPLSSLCQNAKGTSAMGSSSTNSSWEPTVEVHWTVTETLTNLWLILPCH